MQVIAADIGNSSVKLLQGRYQPATDDGSTSAIHSDWESSRTLSPADFQQQLNSLESSHWLISSVSPSNEHRLSAAAHTRQIVDSWTVIDHNMIPMPVALPARQSVGIDRLLAAYAAFHRFSHAQPCVVIDCGTALTVDLVSQEGVFQGGTIVAGPRASLRALSELTEALPDLSDCQIRPPKDIVGKSTREAMLSGAYFAQLGTIKEIVAAVSQDLSQTPVVVGTGGAMGELAENLPKDWILVDNLVLEALWLVGPDVLKHQIATWLSG